jgi:hypothetical protein
LALTSSVFAADRLTPYSKTTDIGAGKHRTELSLSPVHYYTPDGGLAPIDTKIGPSSSAAGAGFKLANETNLLRSYFAGDRAWVRTAGGSTELSFGPEVVRWSSGGAVENIGTATGATPTVDGSKVRYAGALPGIDAEFNVGPASLAKSYLISSRPALPAMGADAFLEIGERVRLKGATLTDMAGHPVTAGPQALGTSLRLNDSLGPMRLDSPIAFDQRMFATPAQRKEMKQAPMPERLTLVVEPQADGSLMFWTRIPYAYLAAPERVYPVVVDPTVTLQPGQPGKDSLLWANGGTNWGDSNWGNWGWLTYWGVGSDVEGAIEFDLTSIPMGSVVNSATLSLWVEGEIAQSPFNAYEFTGSWVEGDGQGCLPCDPSWITYNNKPARNAVPAAVALGVPQGQFMTFDLTASVDGMLNGGTNNGWHIDPVIGDQVDTIASDGQAMGGFDPLHHPKLVVDYSDAPPPDPGGGDEDVLAKLDAIEIKLDSNIPDKLGGLGVKLDAINVKLDALEVKLDTTIPDKLAGLAVKLDAIEIKLDEGGGLGPKLDAIEIKLDDEARFTDDAELSVVEAKLDDEVRWVDDAELALVEGQISLVEAKLDDETRFTDDAELAVIEAKLDAKDDRIESVEGKLDDETRFTDDSELASSQATIIAEIDANEVKIDAIEAKLDGLSEKDELLQIEIEKSLLLHDRISHFYLPAAFGGRLELVREIVVEAIVQNQAAGIDVGNAPTSVAQGDVHYAAGEWKAAYDEYQQAYRIVVTGN